MAPEAACSQATPPDRCLQPRTTNHSPLHTWAQEQRGLDYRLPIDLAADLHEVDVRRDADERDEMIGDMRNREEADHDGRRSVECAE
jgi:hypothetical protein